jgi:hypothetical protein
MLLLVRCSSSSASRALHCSSLLKEARIPLILWNISPKLSALPSMCSGFKHQPKAPELHGECKCDIAAGLGAAPGVLLSPQHGGAGGGGMQGERECDLLSCCASAGAEACAALGLGACVLACPCSRPGMLGERETGSLLLLL